MRVLVDGHLLGGHETGNETYITNLLTGLSHLSEVTCAVGVAPQAEHQFSQGKYNLELLELRPANDVARITYSLARLAKCWKADLLHATYVGPLKSPCPLVISVHDVSFKRYPEFFSPRDHLLFNTLLPLSMRNAAAIITISEHAKQEISTFFPKHAHKIHVTPLAAPSIFKRVEPIEAMSKVRNRFGIRKEFVLAVGNVQPRKNLLRLIRVFSMVTRIAPDIQLVIVGKADWKASEVFKLVHKLKLEHSVHFTDYVTNHELVQLYNAATLFVYASLYEGFGLPILEAMACGTPVISSNRTSMPEVAGKAAILVNPESDDELTDAMIQVLTKPEIARQLKEKGLVQTRKFTWLDTAKATLEVYSTVLQQT